METIFLTTPILNWQTFYGTTKDNALSATELKTISRDNYISHCITLVLSTRDKKMYTDVIIYRVFNVNIYMTSQIHFHNFIIVFWCSRDPGSIIVRYNKLPSIISEVQSHNCNTCYVLDDIWPHLKGMYRGNDFGKHG